MADPQKLLREFVERFEAGERVQPQELLARARPDDRRELAALLDDYLAHAPRRRFDPEAFASSPARPLVDDLTQALEGRAGAWPVLLPRLRAGARLKRSALVAALAEALGVSGNEAKVGAYYHAMEQGTLDPRGVSDRVLEALAALTGTTAQALRDAASAIAPRGPAPSSGPAFARTAMPDAEHLDVMASRADDSAGGDRPQRDEVDDLFTGGVS